MKKVIVFVYLTFLVCIGFSLVSCGEDAPTKALSDFLTAMKERNGEKTWSLLSADSKKDYEESAFGKLKNELSALPRKAQQQVKLPDIGITVDNVLKMTAEEFFCLRLKNVPVDKKLEALDTRRLMIEKKEIKNDSALITVKNLEEFRLVKEQDGWKVNLKF